MTAPATWASVHAGDTVQGADGGHWTVTARDRGPTWLGSGIRNDMFTLVRDSRTITAARALRDPAPLVQRADHSAEAAAVGALIHGGFTVDVLSEGPPMTDPFGAAMNGALLKAADQLTDAEFEAVSPQIAGLVAPAAPAKTTAVKFDRWNRYVLPHPVTGVEQAWTRATTVARTLADEYNLTQWKLRMVAKGLALRPDLIAGAAAADPDEDKGSLNSIAEQAMERAGSSAGRNLGSALHAFTHRLNRGEALAGLGVPPPLDRDLAAYQAALKGHGLGVRAELCERIVVCPELGVAGTFDAIVTQPTGLAKAGPMAVLDLKTAKHVAYSWLEIAIQLAIYTHASHMWDPATGTYIAMPGREVLDRARGLVLHLPVGKAAATLYAVDLIKGWAAAQMAIRVRAARSAAKDLAWLVQPDAATLLLHRIQRADRAELARLWDKHHPAGEWSEAVNAAATARMNELSAVPA